MHMYIIGEALGGRLHFLHAARAPAHVGVQGSTLIRRLCMP